MCYTMKQYENRIQKLAEIDDKIKELEKERDAITDDIKDDMGDNESIETAKIKITFAKIFSNRFDSAAFKAAHGELYTAFQKPQITRRFTYKIK